MKVKKVKINLKSLEDVGKETIEVMRSVESGKKVAPKPHEIVFPTSWRSVVFLPRNASS